MNRSERVDIDSRRAEGLDTRRARMRSCESSEAGELSRGRMQDAGALCGMRTFCGPAENANQDFDVGPDPDTQEEDPPPLGWTPYPEERPQSRSSRPVGVSSAFSRGVETCNQQNNRTCSSFGPSGPKKAYLLVHTKVGAPASEDTVTRSQMWPDLCRRWPARQPRQ